MPRLPILTANNINIYPEWHTYIAQVYKEPITGDAVVDLNTFTFFYNSGDAYPAVRELLSGRVDPCLKVCTLRSWPDRPAVYEGTLFVGDSGPEEAVGQLGFFVVRGFISTAEAASCASLEVMHVRTDWLGGEQGVSWFFHTIGSGVKLDCRTLPVEGSVAVYQDRMEWVSEHGGVNWVQDDHILGAMERDNQAMIIFTRASFTVFNQAGENPSTEIVVRHRFGWSRETASDRGSCLDDPAIGIRLLTGIFGTLPCDCIVYSDTRAAVNCAGTPPGRVALPPPLPPAVPPPPLPPLPPLLPPPLTPPCTARA